MFERLIKHSPRMADSISTTKQTILVMLHVCFIWDLSRKEYIDFRIRHYERHCNQTSERSQNKKECASFQLSSSGRSAEDMRQDGRIIRYFNSKRNISDRSVRLEYERLLDTGFDCPIPPLPKLIRIYRISSTVYFIYATLKYASLCALYYGWLDIDKAYGCYLPGRVAFLPDPGLAKELPWVALIISFYHLVWRVLWCFVDRIDVDCLMFLCYERDTILDKQYAVIELNDPNITPPNTAYLRYLCNKIFYRRQINSQGHAFYTMKKHRSVEHYEKMQDLMVRLRLFYIYLSYATMVAMSMGSMYTYSRHDYFDLSYPSCRSFSHSADNENFNWSFEDKFRSYYLLADLLENTIFIIDTGLIMTLAFAVCIILTHDLCLRFDELRTRTHHLNEKFRSSILTKDLAMGVETPRITHSITKFMENLHRESDWIFNETICTFKQIGQADDFIRRYSTYAVYGWLLTYSSFQATSILSLLPKGGLVTSFNQIALGSISLLYLIAYFLIARPYHRARLLYREICIAMALCPNIPKSKIAWRWLLEYYRDSNIYSLHLIGKSFTLNNLNIIRCASWFVTCTVVLLSLLRH